MYGILDEIEIVLGFFGFMATIFYGTFGATKSTVCRVDELVERLETRMEVYYSPGEGKPAYPIKKPA